MNAGPARWRGGNTAIQGAPEAPKKRLNTPGAPGWHLAPLSMGWENLASDRELCWALKDTTRNGNREANGIVEHLANDPLVQWAWAPGTRVPPPVAQSEFHALARRWLETGAVCPRD